MDDSTIMISSRFLATNSLLESLISISNEVISIDRFPFVHARNITSTIRRIMLLSSLFEEIQFQISDHALTPSILCFTELFSLITIAKLLIQKCKDGSYLWGLIRLEFISNQFYVLAKEMRRAFDIMPLMLFNITTDMREQMELLHKQTKRVKLFIDLQDLQRRDQLLQVMANNSLQNKKSKGFIEFEKVEEMLSSIGLRNPSDYDKEISRLEVEARNQAGTGELMVVSNIKSLLSLILYSKSMLLRDREN